MSFLFDQFIKTAEANKMKVLTSITEKPGAEFLDCGCADGLFTIQLARRLKTYNISGIDLSEKLLKKARKRGIKTYKMDLNKKLSIKSNKFDVIVANQIIEHLYDTDNFIKEIRRILKSGGYAIISTPNLSSWHNIFSLLIGKQPFPCHVSNNIIVGNPLNPLNGRKHETGFSHLRLFTFDSLEGLLKYYGFSIERSIGVGYYPFPQFISGALSRMDKEHSAYVLIKAKK
jgi:SAM-dependent methyltransferase